MLLLVVFFVFMLFLGVVPQNSGMRSFGTTFFQWGLCKMLWDFIINIGIKSWDRSFGIIFGTVN